MELVKLFSSRFLLYDIRHVDNVPADVLRRLNQTAPPKTSLCVVFHSLSQKKKQTDTRQKFTCGGLSLTDNQKTALPAFIRDIYRGGLLAGQNGSFSARFI